MGFEGIWAIRTSACRDAVGYSQRRPSHLREHEPVRLNSTLSQHCGGLEHTGISSRRSERPQSTLLRGGIVQETASCDANPWVLPPKMGMGYGVSQVYGLSPAYELEIRIFPWVIRGYGFCRAWDKRVSTVVESDALMSPQQLRQGTVSL